MILAVLAALQAAPAPAAESDDLARKAQDPSFSAVLSAEEVLHRDFRSPTPRTDEFQAAEPGTWRWFGRSLPVLDPLPPGTAWHAQLGNEIGDPLFREAEIEPASNRNPSMRFDLSAPLPAGWRTGARFEQVDHFSDRILGMRHGLAGRPELGGAGPATRRAWFGENMPGHSFVEGAVENPDLAGLSLRTGWIWLPSPGALEPQGWRATAIAGRISAAGLQWHHAQGWFDRADTIPGSSRQAQGWIGTKAIGDSSTGLRFGVAYTAHVRRGDVAWNPGEALQLQPRVDAAFARDGWRLGGSHQAGTAFFLLRDTLAWSLDRPSWGTTIQALGAWTDRPDGLAPWSDSSRAGPVRMEARDLEQSYALRGLLRLGAHPLTFSVETSPWWVVHPRAFRPSGFDTLPRSGDLSWVVRAGEERALPGVLWGWKGGCQVQASPTPWLTTDLKARFDPVLGGPASRVDLTPPLWTFSVGARAAHRSGFSLRPNLLWRDDAVVRHRSPEPWTVPAGFEANLWIDQSYFRERVTFSLAALNLLSDDPHQLPNAGEDRFRLLVGLSAQVF